MPQDVVGVDEGLARGEGQALGVAHPHQQGAHEARSAGDGDGVDVGKGQPRVVQGALHHGAHLVHMVAAGQLRHHAAELAVDGDLGIDGVREHLPPVFHQGGGGLVAGGLYGKDGGLPPLLQGAQPCPGDVIIAHRSRRLPLPAPPRERTRSSSGSPPGCPGRRP